MESRLYSSHVFPNRLLPGIHGLRGIAALMIVLSHIVHLINLPVPDVFMLIAEDFHRGVFLFFVVSAFSLMYSTQHTIHRPTWLKEYLIKRFLRIAPLFYCVLAMVIVWKILTNQTAQLDMATIILNLSFTFGLVPWDGLVPAGWTVGVEMLFYVIFPIILLLVRTPHTAAILLILSVAVSYAVRSSLYVHYQYTTDYYLYNWSHFLLGSNLFFFAMGVYAFRVMETLKKNSVRLHAYIPLSAIAILGGLMLTELEEPYRGVGGLDLMLWGLGFTLLCIWQGHSPSWWSANKVMGYLGERSYSIYLLHPLLIRVLKQDVLELYHSLTPYIGTYAYFICALLFLLPLLLAAELSYRLIELPGIRLGKGLNNRLVQAHQNKTRFDPNKG